MIWMVWQILNQGNWGAESRVSVFHPGESVGKRGHPTEWALICLPGSGGETSAGKDETETRVILSELRNPFPWCS